ncbi:Piso0_005385 [Millerozyma farinosa CBS 7064]|uniref:Piso0_005385 protein n=1 Tax=Pichia sorbitophila (strain ATCC MYA-4447 / BCRC 22081 / CBS 7064 / NBRC 10061 / NRRL Y-12695) TaxID=559304 RepID=G8Y215_PICSO|nr:Piso0_005385 [Millerozyma farinosa CBS 7064]
MKKDKHSETHSKKGNEANSEKLKLTVRLLPAALTWEQFTSQLEKYTDIRSNGGITNEYYVQGFYPKSPYELPSFSRAYLLFKNTALMRQFIEQVKDKPFVEEKTGNQMMPQLEKALYSKMPTPESKLQKPANKPIEKDHIFKEFLACLEDGKPFDLLETSQRIRTSAREKKKNGASSKKVKKNASKGDGKKQGSQSKKKKGTDNNKPETAAADKKPQEKTKKKSSSEGAKQPAPRTSKNEKKSDKKKPKKTESSTGPNQPSKPDAQDSKSKSGKGSKKGSKNKKNDPKENASTQDQKPKVLLQPKNKKDADIPVAESHPKI